MTAAAESTSESGAVKYVTAASMIDCTGAAAQKNPVIVLKGKRIDKIGTKDSIKIPQGADVLDCGQCTLIPGMMDIHLHTMMFNCLTFHNHRVAQWEITPRAAADVRRLPRPALLRHGLHHAARSRPQLAARPAGGGSLRHPRCLRCRHSGRPAHVRRRLHHHHRLAPGADPAARRRPPRLPDRRRAVGTAQARAHQPSCRLRRHQDLHHRRRRHRQGRAGHPQHDAGRARRGGG